MASWVSGILNNSAGCSRSDTREGGTLRTSHRMVASDTVPIGALARSLGCELDDDDAAGGGGEDDDGKGDVEPLLSGMGSR
jgi:hypothetical protein